MGVQERRRREREARERAILEAAKEVFLEKGFEFATVEEIAQRAELGKGTLYSYFRNKEEIYLALLGEGVEELFEEIEGVLRMSLGTEEMIERLARVYFGYYRRNRAFFRIFVFGRRRSPFSVLPRELVRPHIERGIRCLGLLSEVLRRGMEEGRFREQDPWRATILCWALINGLLFLYEDDINREIMGLELGDLTTSAIEFCLKGLKG